MDLITSIRAQLPATGAAPQPAPTEPGHAFKAHQGAAGPVAATTMTEAVQQVAPRSAVDNPQRLAAQMSAETSAAAAEAAKEAYIRASIAAGINPLPLS